MSLHRLRSYGSSFRSGTACGRTEAGNSMDRKSQKCPESKLEQNCRRTLPPKDTSSGPGDVLSFSTRVCLFYRVLTTVRTFSSGSACQRQLRLYCHSVRAGGGRTLGCVPPATGCPVAAKQPISTPILNSVFARKQRVTEVQGRGLQGNQGTTVSVLFYSLLAQDLR